VRDSGEVTESLGASASATDAGRLRLELRPPANHVNRKAILWWTLSEGAWSAAAVIGCTVALALGIGPPWLLVAAVVLLVVAVFDLAIWPRLRYRYHRWETTDQAVYVQYGVLLREWRVAPLSRVQTVDTERGPLQQWLGLSTVTVTTASAAGPLKIRGLAHDEAAALVDRLTAVTEATRGDAT
jgi:membrane protein YdbS with pleckstrin-like domain